MLALGSDARVDVVHVLDESAMDDEREEGTGILRAAERILDGVDHVDTDLVVAADVAAEIVARSDPCDVTVLGAPTAGLLEQFDFGTVPDTVMRRTENTVSMTKHRSEDSSMYHRWIAGDAEERI